MISGFLDLKRFCKFQLTPRELKVRVIHTADKKEPLNLSKTVKTTLIKHLN